MRRICLVLVLTTAVLGCVLGCDADLGALLQGSNTAPEGGTTPDGNDDGVAPDADPDPAPTPDDPAGGDPQGDTDPAPDDGDDPGDGADPDGGDDTNVDPDPDPLPEPEPEPEPVPTLTETAWTTCGGAGLSDDVISATFSFAEAARDDGMTTAQAVPFVQPSCTAHCAVPVEFCDAACFACVPAVVNAAYE